MANKNKKDQTLKLAAYVIFKGSEPKRDERGRIIVYWGDAADIKQYAEKGEAVKYTRVGVSGESVDIKVKDVENETVYVAVKPKEKNQVKDYKM